MQVFVAVACGIVFGFALQKAGVYKVSIIREQFVFSSCVMLKVRDLRCSSISVVIFYQWGKCMGAQMFLSAATVSTVVITAFHHSTPSMRDHCCTITGFVRIHYFTFVGSGRRDWKRVYPICSTAFPLAGRPQLLVALSLAAAWRSLAAALEQ